MNEDTELKIRYLAELRQLINCAELANVERKPFINSAYATKASIEEDLYIDNELADSRAKQ